jgi:GntR family negative regulator for fad regulon and positive regulator of fabA
MDWKTPQKPAEITENQLIEAILSGHFPIDSTLPGERDLAGQLGVTRPTLREALQRLARDGWVEINQGKPTRVCNYWQEGNLAVLAAIARHRKHLPTDFVPNLLSIRMLLAPAYARAAVEKNPQLLEELLAGYEDLPEDAEAFSLADWELHHLLTVCSENPVFTLILNGFQDLYPTMGRQYYQNPEGRQASRRFYQGLLESVRAGDAEMAEQVTLEAMERSMSLWKSMTEA